jgi:hypothetical protein
MTAFSIRNISESRLHLGFAITLIICTLLHFKSHNLVHRAVPLCWDWDCPHIRIHRSMFLQMHFHSFAARTLPLSVSW